MKFYRVITDKKAIAAVYEEDMNWEHDPPTREYEAWAVTSRAIERIYIAKSTLEQHCILITEEEAGKVSLGLIETLRIARPDEVRPAQASPHYICEHGEGCLLTEHSQGQLWRDAQIVNADRVLQGSA